MKRKAFDLDPEKAAEVFSSHTQSIINEFTKEMIDAAAHDCSDGECDSAHLRMHVCSNKMAMHFALPLTTISRLTHNLHELGLGYLVFDAMDSAIKDTRTPVRERDGTAEAIKKRLKMSNAELEKLLDKTDEANIDVADRYQRLRTFMRDNVRAPQVRGDTLAIPTSRAIAVYLGLMAKQDEKLLQKLNDCNIVDPPETLVKMVTAFLTVLSGSAPPREIVLRTTREALVGLRKEKKDA